LKLSKYTNYVRTLPCCVSGYIGEEVQAHHIIGYNWLVGKAMGKKGSDLACIPLKHSIHMELHDIGWASFEKKHNISQVEMVIKTLLQAERDGVVRV